MTRGDIQTAPEIKGKDTDHIDAENEVDQWIDTGTLPGNHEVIEDKTEMRRKDLCLNSRIEQLQEKLWKTILF